MKRTSSSPIANNAIACPNGIDVSGMSLYSCSVLNTGVPKLTCVSSPASLMCLRTASAAFKILEDALAIQDAGCFMLEFEAVPAKIARTISQQLEIPTIGIGAGNGTDGQILLSYDLLGVFTDFKPKFTKRYTNLTEVAVGGLKQYVAEVKSGAYREWMERNYGAR